MSHSASGAVNHTLLSFGIGRFLTADIAILDCHFHSPSFLSTVSLYPPSDISHPKNTINRTLGKSFFVGYITGKFTKES